jgi:hypothetical protein
MTELYAPVQVVVDTDKLLDQIGWRETDYNYEGEEYEQTGPANLRKGLAAEVAKVLAPQLRSEMVEVVREVANEVAHERVAAVVDEVMAGEIRKTNSWGEPTGEPVTLREILVAEVKTALERKVDTHGRPAGYSRDGMPYVDYVARTAAAEAIKGELAPAVKDAVAEVKSKVTSIVSEHLAAQITREVVR